MNRQGDQMGQFSRNNANMQHEVDGTHEANTTSAILRLFSSSISRTGRNGQRFHDRFSASIVGPDPESANLFPANNDLNNAGTSPTINESIGATGINIPSSTSLPAVATHHGIDSAAGYAGNSSSNNNNVSLDLSLLPYGAQNESADDGSSSVQNQIVINTSSTTGAAAEQGGGDGGSTSTRRTPFKRNTPDYALSEFVTGESSRAGAAQAEAEAAAAAAGGIPKRRAGNDNMNISSSSSATCTCTTCPLHGTPGHHHEAGNGNNHGHGTGNVWPMAEVQQALQNQNEGFQRSNMDLQAGTVNTQGYVQPSLISSIGYLPSHPPSFYQNSNFFSQAATTPSVNAYCLSHPFENHLPSYRHSQYTPSWTNIMMPRTTPSVSFPRRSVNLLGSSGSESNIAPFFQSPRNNSTISSNFMLTPPRIGRGSNNWVQSPANLSLQLLSNLGNNNNANFFGAFSLPSSSSGSGSSAQHGNIVPAYHQLSGIARAWIRRLNVHDEYLRISYGSDAPQGNFYTIGSPLVTGTDRNQAGGGNLPPYIADVNRLRQEIRNAIEHLRNGGSIRLEELLILDYSIVLNLLESVTEFAEPPNVEDVPYEALLNIEERIGNAVTGLNETEIMTYIGRRIFKSNEETQQHDACSICQEDYVDGEELGRLDCGHRYHLDCIKQWLVLKNTCPICKQMALTIIDEDDEDDE